MENNFYQILDFPSSQSINGMLAMFQGNDVESSKKLPFNIKRVLVMKGMNAGDVRGGHTHHKTRQFLLAISGGCTVELFDGKQKAEIKLGEFNKGIVLEPYVWHVMKEYEPNTILLVLADSEYDEKDYIRSYDDFLKFVK